MVPLPYQINRTNAVSCVSANLDNRAQDDPAAHLLELEFAAQLEDGDLE
jgi:hypothetical protein